MKAKAGDWMYIEEQPVSKPHEITMHSRGNIRMTGVVDVISYDNAEIILQTTSGLLMIRGNELHLNHLSLEKGETGVDGTVDSLTYSEVNPGAKQAGRLLGRLFK